MKSLIFTKVFLFSLAFLFYLNSSNGVARDETVAYSLSSGQSVAVNDKGDVLLAGYTLTEKPVKDTAKSNRFQLLDYFNKNIFVSKFDKDGRQLWLQTLATPAGVDIERVLVDEQGNSYVTGRTKESLDGETRGEFDAFLAKYNAEGEQLWLKQFGTSRSDLGSAITLKSTGEIILASLTYTDINETTDVRNVPQDEVFLSQWSTDGEQQWLRQFRITDRQYISVSGIAIDAKGRIFLTGGTSKDRVITTPAGIDVYITKFTEDGFYLWQQTFGGGMHTFSRAIEAHKDSVFVIGTTAGGNNVGERDYDSYDPERLSNDAILAVYDSYGNKDWIKQFGARESYDGKDVTVNSSNNAIVVGSGNGSLGGDPLGLSDAFIALYDTEGQQMWANNLGTEAFDAAMSVAIDGDDNIYVTGYLYETWDDMYRASAQNKNAGHHLFLTKYTSDGRQMWLRTIKSEDIR